MQRRAEQDGKTESLNGAQGMYGVLVEGKESDFRVDSNKLGHNLPARTVRVDLRAGRPGSNGNIALGQLVEVWQQYAGVVVPCKVTPAVVTNNLQRYHWMNNVHVFVPCTGRLTTPGSRSDSLSM